MKNKKSSKAHKSSFFDTKEKKLGACIAAAVIILLIAVLMFMESSDGKIVIENNTDLKLEYVKAYYVYSEGNVNEGIETKSIDANKSLTLPQEPINLRNSESNLEVRFKFENHDEIFVDAGYFNDNFKGNVLVNFEQTDDATINLKVKAKNGLLKSKQIDCNENFTIDLNNDFVEE